MGPTGIWDLLVLFSSLDMGFNMVFSILTVSTEDLQVYGTYRYMGPTGFNQLVGHGFQHGVLNPHCKYRTYRYRGPTGIGDLLILFSWLDMGFNRVFSIPTLSTEDLLVLFSWLDMGFNRVFSIPTVSTEDFRYMGPTGFIQLVGHWFQ